MSCNFGDTVACKMTCEQIFDGIEPGTVAYGDEDDHHDLATTHDSSGNHLHIPRLTLFFFPIFCVCLLLFHVRWNLPLSSATASVVAPVQG